MLRYNVLCGLRWIFSNGYELISAVVHSAPRSFEDGIQVVLFCAEVLPLFDVQDGVLSNKCL